MFKEKKLHKTKITHCEFGVHDPNIFVTSSIDSMVKIWDLRNISDAKSNPEPLITFNHLKGVNSGMFITIITIVIIAVKFPLCFVSM